MRLADWARTRARSSRGSAHTHCTGRYGGDGKLGARAHTYVSILRIYMGPGGQAGSVVVAHRAATDCCSSGCLVAGTRPPPMLGRSSYPRRSAPAALACCWRIDWQPAHIHAHTHTHTPTYIHTNTQHTPPPPELP